GPRLPRRLRAGGDTVPRRIRDSSASAALPRPPRTRSKRAEPRRPQFHAAARRPDKSRELHGVVVSAPRGRASSRRRRSLDCRRALSKSGPAMTRIALGIVAVVLAASAAEARIWTVGGPDADFPLIAPAIA